MLYIVGQMNFHPLYEPGRADISKCHRLGGPSNRSLLSHSPGGREAEINMSAELVPSEAMREDLLHASPLTSGGLLAVSGGP